MANATDLLCHPIQSNPSKKEEGADAPPVEGLDPEAWRAWINYRASIKKPIRRPSIPLAQRSLAAFGLNQLAVVEQSIAQGWQGLFDLKAKPKQQAELPPGVTRWR